MHTSAFVRAALVALVSGAVGVGMAQAQTVVPKREKKTPQPSKTTNQPATTPPPGAPATATVPVGPPIVGPYVTQNTPKDWILEIRLRVMSDQPTRLDSTGMPDITPFSFTETALLFPEVTSSASHTLNARGITGNLKLDDKIVFEFDGNQQFLYGGIGHSGTNLIKLDYKSPNGEMQARQISMQLRLPVTCFKTKFDEAAAMQVGWPKKDWPEIAKLTFKPQMYVDMDGQGQYDPTEMQAAVKRWISAAGVADPKAVAPVRLAKIIAGGVVSDIQPNGDGISCARTGEFEGYVVNAPGSVIAAKRGSEIEMVTVLVDALRLAGLPARLVFGQEGVEGGENDKTFLTKKSGGKQLRAWVEFCLYDETKNTINWVPIDIVKLRKSSSRPPPLDREWRYFGTHEDLNGIIPFAFTFHPPVPAVLSYSVPAFYGWIMSPASPTKGYQMLEFSPSRASKTADKSKNDSKNKDPNANKPQR